jgi:acyl carrier protein phosphodiesterase
MNFLGHFFLAGDSTDLIVGNFIADHIKGKKYESYPDAIAEGILMHRSIDAYTDTHDSFRKSRKRLWPKYRLYSGVIVDMFYDHYLASNWSVYSEQHLEVFARNIYEIIAANWDLLPYESKYMFPFMRNGNWLVRYAETEGIHQSLSGMARRAKYHSKMEEAVHDLRLHYDLFQEEFNEFIADISEKFKTRD